MTELSDKALQAISDGKTKVLEHKPEWKSPPVIEIGKLQGFRNRWGIKISATRADDELVWVRETHDLEKMKNSPKTEQQARMILIEPVKEMMARLETYLDPKCLCSADNPVLCPVIHARKE